MRWNQKHSPKKTADIQGHALALMQLRNYVQNFRRGSKPIMIYGPPGVGKTCAVYALANELDLELLEVNASDKRNKDEIESTIGPATKQLSLFAKKKLILIDELDGISGAKDRGGVAAIAKIVVESSFPIVLTANEPYDKRLDTLRKKSILIEFKPLPYTSILAFLKKVCEKESVTYDEEALKSLARLAGGDMRGAVDDLETAAINREFTKKDFETIDARAQKESIIQAMTRVFKTKEPEVFLGAYDSVDEDLDKIFLWLDENISKEYKKPKDLAMAYDAISMADVFFGRIRRWQYYRFYVYCFELLSAGVALAKEERYEGFTAYGPTTRLLKIWQANMRNMSKKAIAEKIAEKSHCSTKRAMQDILPYMKAMFKNRSSAVQLAQAYRLDEPEVLWMGK